MNSRFSDRVIALLAEEVERAGGLREFSRKHGLQPSKISRWLSGHTSPKVSDIGEIFDLIGVDITRDAGDCGGRPVVFEVPSGVLGRDLETLEQGRYVAVPIVDDPTQLTSYAVPESNRSGWALVERSFASVQARRDLIVVPVDCSDMAPTLNEGDLVLVDRERVPVEHGRIYLCRAPRTCATGFRRVVIRPMPDGDAQIFLTNDARGECTAPRAYSLRHDYGGDIYRCVLGRAVWMRCDITKK